MRAHRDAEGLEHLCCGQKLGELRLLNPEQRRLRKVEPTSMPGGQSQALLVCPVPRPEIVGTNWTPIWDTFLLG